MFSLDSKKENVHNASSMVHVKQNFSRNAPTDQRKTLQVLQQTPDNRLTRTPAQLLQSGKSNQPMKKKVFPIFKDASHTSSPRTQPKKACVHASSQTEGESCCHCTCHEEDEAFRLMGQEEVPEDYWKELAENRRQALEDSLHENELLHESVGELRRENKRLSELAEHAEYFANILKEISQEKDGDSETESQTKVKESEKKHSSDNELRDSDSDEKDSEEKSNLCSSESEEDTRKISKTENEDNRTDGEVTDVEKLQ